MIVELLWPRFPILGYLADVRNVLAMGHGLHTRIMIVVHMIRTSTSDSFVSFLVAEFTER